MYFTRVFTSTSQAKERANMYFAYVFTSKHDLNSLPGLWIPQVWWFWLRLGRHLGAKIHKKRHPKIVFNLGCDLGWIFEDLGDQMGKVLVEWRQGRGTVGRGFGSFWQEPGT